MPGGKFGSIAYSAFSKDFWWAISRVMRKVSASRMPGSSVRLIRRSYTILARASAAMLERRSQAGSPIEST